MSELLLLAFFPQPCSLHVDGVADISLRMKPGIEIRGRGARLKSKLMREACGFLRCFGPKYRGKPKSLNALSNQQEYFNNDDEPEAGNDEKHTQIHTHAPI